MASESELDPEKVDRFDTDQGEEWVSPDGYYVLSEDYDKLLTLYRALKPVPLESCDRADILLQRFSNAGYLTATGTKWVKDHIRLALNMEVEAGGPFLVPAAKAEIEEGL